MVFGSLILESFLRNRSSLDHEATAMMKAQFMSLWDGLDTSLTTKVKIRQASLKTVKHLPGKDVWAFVKLQVMVMGATNRPQDVDPAILRRMPATFHVGLPVRCVHARSYS